MEDIWLESSTGRRAVVTGRTGNVLAYFRQDALEILGWSLFQIHFGQKSITIYTHGKKLQKRLVFPGKKLQKYLVFPGKKL